jgi:signal peptidase II
MGSHAQGGGVGGRSVADAAPTKADGSNAWGRLSAFGLFVAAMTCLLDQAAKFWLLLVLHLTSHAPLAIAPFVELVLTWNTGISYGLFPQNGPVGPWALLAFKVVAVGFLWIWLARSTSRLTALALGLIIGGAVGNAIDRLHWPGVMDFVLLHVETATWSFRWYVFNLADVAIVAGVVGLLYESLQHGGAAKAP